MAVRTPGPSFPVHQDKSVYNKSDENVKAKAGIFFVSALISAFLGGLVSQELPQIYPNIAGYWSIAAGFLTFCAGTSAAGVVVANT